MSDTTPTNATQEVSQTSAHTDQEGQIFDGKYKVVEDWDNAGGHFNKGIFLVEHMTTKEQVICKTLPPGMGRQESEILAKVSPHPSIVTFIESSLQPAASLTGDRIYMEHCDDDTLQRECAIGMMFGNQPSEDFVLSVFRDLTAAVKHLQYGPPGAENWEPVIHRDIKPSNIFLTMVGRGEDEHPRAKLGDFGCAYTRKECLDIMDDYDNRLAGAEQEPGLLHSDLFMEPEDPMSFRLTADAYQIALVIYWMMNEGDVTDHQEGTKHLSCSKKLRRLLRWCLREDPYKRPNILQLEKLLAESVVEGEEQEQNETVESA